MRRVAHTIISPRRVGGDLSFLFCSDQQNGLLWFQLAPLVQGVDWPNNRQRHTGTSIENNRRARKQMTTAARAKELLCRRRT